MITLPVVDRERERVEMIHSFGLFDRPRVAVHDEIAALARDLAGSESSLVSLVGSETNWFAGAANFDAPQQCRWTSFCTHVVAAPDAPLWIEDAQLDYRFASNPFVVGEPHLRFYAGLPIRVSGFAVGSLCVLDSQPRAHDARLLERLARLASIAGDDLATRHQARVTRGSLLASADALIECDDHGIITDWSEGAERLFGFTAAEALGRKVSLIVPPDRVVAHDKGFEHWRRSGTARLERRIELEAQRKDGSRIDIELWMSVAHIRGVRHIHSNIRDISDRRRQTQELLAAKLEAEAANLAKSTFLANMSHELRTPLNGVVALADLLAGTPLSDKQREMTSIIQTSSDQLRRLVGDILDLARIESGEVLLAQAPLSVSGLVEDVKNLSALAAQAKGLDLVVQVSEDLTEPVLGDSLRLKQVLTNLVSNAIKFTDKGSVTVRVTATPSGIRFDVTDTGIGFDDTQRAVIFERFQQADGTITRRFGGTGLGLPISRELVTLMGGTLDCAGRAGEGASFWFTLALPAATPADEGPVDALEPERPIERVLVVDDNATNRRVAEMLLASAGVTVVCVDDGEQAVDAFLHDRYDAILMDMMMPVMDGIAATQAIRRIETIQGLDRTPIVMLTANNLPEHVAASLEAGADVHLAKPVNPTALFETLGELHARPRQCDRSGSMDAVSVAL